MLLKRHYRYDDHDRPILDYIEVKHTGANPVQHFSTRFVQQGLREHWITMAGDTLILHAQPEDLRYTVRRTPGEDVLEGRLNYYDCVLDAEQHERYRTK